MKEKKLDKMRQDLLNAIYEDIEKFGYETMAKYLKAELNIDI